MMVSKLKEFDEIKIENKLLKSNEELFCKIKISKPNVLQVENDAFNYENKVPYSPSSTCYDLKN
jgi:hypothetical protein